MDFETFEKLRFILNRQIEIALAPREAILEAINRYYGQTVGESADSMLQEFTDTAIDFTETEEDAERQRRRGRREQRPDRPAGPPDDHRGGATCGPRTSTSSRSRTAFAIRYRIDGVLVERDSPPDGCWAPSSRASRFSPSWTSPSDAAPRTAGSRSPWARRNSTFG